MAKEQSGVKRLKHIYLVLLTVTCLGGISFLSTVVGKDRGTQGISSGSHLDTARDKDTNKSFVGLQKVLTPPESGAVVRPDSKNLTGQTATVSRNLTNQTKGSGSALSLGVDEPIWRPTSTGLRKLPWTSIYGKHENDSFHFFSAYYDDRASAPGRPAVLVMGYSYDAVYNQKVVLYCVFKYLNGTTACRSSPATERHPNNCYKPSLGAKPRHYICSMNADEEPPMYVQLSNSSLCESEFTSGEIPVRNRHHAKPTKKFGICISGPLIQESRRILQDLIQFIEFSQLMGAEFIIMYANETQIDQDILEYLWKHYPGVVRTIGWKWFKKWHPLHYFGQLLLMSDCLYQVMYEVENLAMMDIDEMIIPVNHDNWREMIESIKVQLGTVAFKFHNVFFDDPNPSSTAMLEKEIDREDPFRFIPKYFTHVRRYTCFPHKNYRTKVINHPRFVVEPEIHGVCRTTADYKITHSVDEKVGFLAHYRHPIPNDCRGKPTHTDRTVYRFNNTLNKKIFSSND